MSYLEQKRNALMNSVASSSGGIEYISTTTLTEQQTKIDIDVDTSEYKTFFVVGTFMFNSTSNVWIYYGLNGTSSKYIPSATPPTTVVPNSTNAEHPIILSATIDGYAVFNFSNFGGQAQKFNVLFDNVTQITFDGRGVMFNIGTELRLYGMKESIIDFE